ncbi:MAG: hypothetical protein ABW061_07050 [Polyangiaceae bacterium]
MKPKASPRVEALLAQERAPLPIAQDVRDRVLARAHEAAGQGIGASEFARPRWLISSRPFLAAAVGVAVVIGIVAALRVLRSEQKPPPIVAASAAPSAAQLPVAPEAPIAPDSTPTPTASGSTLAPVDGRTRNARPVASDRASDGLDELSLLSRARQADGRGDFAAVLDRVREHAQKYPTGRLSEEREVLRVKALVGLGRVEQARRAAAQFRQAFPRSVLLHKVDEMVPSPP